MSFYLRTREENREQVRQQVRRKLSREYQHLRDPRIAIVNQEWSTRHMLPDLKQHQERLGTWAFEPDPPLPTQLHRPDLVPGVNGALAVPQATDTREGFLLWGVREKKKEISPGIIAPEGALSLRTEQNCSVCIQDGHSHFPPHPSLKCMFLQFCTYKQVK